MVICVLLSPLAMAEEIFVSPAGNDQNDGKLSTPLASIAVAQARVRAFKQNNPKQPITVYLRGGKYYLTEPVVFNLRTAGRRKALWFTRRIRTRCHKYLVA